MRVASVVGFLATVVVGIGAFTAFTWADRGWVTVLLFLLALLIAWFSVGIYARASTDAANRALRGVASDSDFEELDRFGDAADSDGIS